MNGFCVCLKNLALGWPPEARKPFLAKLYRKFQIAKDVGHNQQLVSVLNRFFDLLGFLGLFITLQPLIEVT
jgi:hypothetical protein